MDETDDRLAPVSYLFGARPSVSSGTAARASAAPAPDAPGSGASGVGAEPAWNDAWGSDLDDACAVLSDEAAARAGARADDPVDGGEANEIDVEKISMRALGRRALSRRELERLLRNGGADDAAVARECDRLSRVGLLDDTALAQTLVGTLQERKGLGRTAIAAELARRMVAPAAIAYALDLVDSGDELARARELARKRAGQLSGLDRDAAVRRLSGYLARRGYSGSTVRAAVDEALPLRAGGGTVRFR